MILKLILYMTRANLRKSNHVINAMINDVNIYYLIISIATFDLDYFCILRYFTGRKYLLMQDYLSQPFKISTRPLRSTTAKSGHMAHQQMHHYVRN